MLSVHNVHIHHTHIPQPLNLQRISSLHLLTYSVLSPPPPHKFPLYTKSTSLSTYENIFFIPLHDPGVLHIPCDTPYDVIIQSPHYPIQELYLLLRISLQYTYMIPDSSHQVSYLTQYNHISSQQLSYIGNLPILYPDRESP